MKAGLWGCGGRAGLWRATYGGRSAGDDIPETTRHSLGPTVMKDMISLFVRQQKREALNQLKRRKRSDLRSWLALCFPGRGLGSNGTAFRLSKTMERVGRGEGRWGIMCRRRRFGES